MKTLMVYSLNRYLAITVMLFSIAMALQVSAQSRNTPEVESPAPPQIVGGNQAAPGEFPFLVRIYVRGGLCGGSLIRDNWVLTAAHCFPTGTLTGEVFVRAGSNLAGSGGEIIAVSQIIKHPSFNPTTFNNDVALLRLQYPITVRNANSTSWLDDNEAGLMIEGSSVTIAGWGATSWGGSLPADDQLRKITVPMSYSTSCADDSNYTTGAITEQMICASSQGKDACQGDSGGPLIKYDGATAWIAGIVSWGEECAKPGYPGVYTRVARFSDWITAQIASDKPSSFCVIDETSSRTGTRIRVNVGSGCSAGVSTAFAAATRFWADFLYSPEIIEVSASFQSLTCSTSSGVLGSAGATYVVQTDTLPEPDLYYPIVLANALTNQKFIPGTPDISMRYNSAIGTANCLSNLSWFYDDGSSSSVPNGTIGLYGVVQHEMAHGLGFMAGMNSNGENYQGAPFIYDKSLYSETQLASLDGLLTDQRKSAIMDDGNLTWQGSAVTGLTSALTAGTANNRVRMYAPSTYASGSSVSHFDTVVTPNELMEPFATTRVTPSTLLTRNLMRDIGWKTLPDAPAISGLAADETAIDVSFAAPYQLGGSALITYTATCGSQSRSGTQTTLRVTNLLAATHYTCTVSATTGIGQSDASAAVTAQTQALDGAPGVPTITSADYYLGEATFELSPIGGYAATQYHVSCETGDAALTGQSSTTRVVITGMTEDVSYFCSASASNAVGGSGTSANGSTVTLKAERASSGLPIWLLYQATQ